MGFFSKLFGGDAAGAKAAKKPAAAPSQQDLMAQRQALAQKVMTADRQDRLAQAFQVQAAKQQLQQRLKTDEGQRQLAEKLQRLMKNG
ncbi:MAG TPA: hypothetical protein VM659_19775 [Dongiaceae bacterium]|nr:hypothetical protein [Dongiaceae bacterium]